MKEQEAQKDIVDNYLQNIDGLLALFIKKKEDREWAHEEIVYGGPRHKQVLSSLLLSKAFDLITQTEQRTGETFTPVKNTPVFNHKYEEEYTMPVDAILSEDNDDREAIAEMISKAPDHESLVYLMVLQAMDWALQKSQ